MSSYRREVKKEEVKLIDYEDGLYKAEESPIFRKEGGLHMNMRKTLVVTAVFTIILGILVAVPVHAQVDFADWVGQWYTGAVQEKGVIVDDLGTYRFVQKIPTYGYIQCWDGTDTYTSWLVQFDTESGTWMDAVPYTVKVIGGTPLDYVAYGFIPPGGPIPEIEIFALILNVKGKEKAGVLSKATVKPVGGCVIYNLGAGPNGTMYFPATESLKFKSVSADKVPIEVQQKIAVIPPCP